MFFRSTEIDERDYINTQTEQQSNSLEGSVMSTVTFLDAMNERYGSEDKTEYEANAFQVGFGGKYAKNHKKWEMVGMEKTRKQQSQHSRLQTIVLKDAMITVPEASAGEISDAKLLRATEVDLSGNFELTVSHVETIIASVPNLELLQLNRIPLLLTAEERLQMRERLVAEGRIEIVPKVGAKDTSAVEMVAKVLPDLPKAFLFLPTCDDTEAVVSATGSMPIPGLEHRLLSGSWPKLKQLVLNGTGITSLMPLRGLDLPLCEEIHLDMNNISNLFGEKAMAEQPFSVQSQFSGLHSVKIVSLALNRLSDWSGDSGLHLIRVHAFPLLTSLFVGGNPLPNLPLKALRELKNTEEKAANQNSLEHLRDLLGCLVALDIADCAAINDHVVSLGAIRTFAPTVATLRVSYETLFPEKNSYPTESIARNLTIASLPNLVILNRAAVRPKERVDAELYYVQRCLAELPELRAQQFSSAHIADGVGSVLPPPATPAEVAAMSFDQLTAGLVEGLSTSNSQQEDEKKASSSVEEHVAGLTAKTLAAYPRYFELRQLYRHVIISQQRGAASGDGSVAGGVGNGFMVEVAIRADAFADQTKRLPSTMTIQKVKVLAAALFSGLDASQMEVSFWVTAGRGDSVAIPLVLSNDMQTLGFYGVPNGATLKIRDLREKQFGKK